MRREAVIVGLVLGLASAGAASADWLVTREGERVETRGPWRVQGKTVVFTDRHGTLSSMRVDTLDLDASRAATEAAEAGPVAAPPSAVEPPAPPPVLTLTNEDVGAGAPGAAGVDLLIRRLRDAHARGDREALLRLVRWQGVAPEVRQVYESTVDYLLAHRIRSVRTVEPDPAELLPQEVEGVVYRPNLPVRAKIDIDLELTEEERASADRASTTFLVGESLGTWVIVAATAQN